MKSKILQKYILEKLIHFECEDINILENPYSSDLFDLERVLKREVFWFSSDTSNTDKPLTVIFDLELKEDNFYTGRVRGIYLLNLNINNLRLDKSSRDIREKVEYFAYDKPMTKLLTIVDVQRDEIYYRYADGFKEKVLGLFCDYNLKGELS